MDKTSLSAYRCDITTKSGTGHIGACALQLESIRTSVRLQTELTFDRQVVRCPGPVASSGATCMDRNSRHAVPLHRLSGERSSVGNCSRRRGRTTRLSNTVIRCERRVRPLAFYSPRSREIRRPALALKLLAAARWEPTSDSSPTSQNRRQAPRTPSRERPKRRHPMHHIQLGPTGRESPLSRRLENRSEAHYPNRTAPHHATRRKVTRRIRVHRTMPQSRLPSGHQLWT